MPTKLTDEIIERLRMLHTELGFNARQFAFAMGVSHSAMSQILSGKTKVLSDTFIYLLDARYHVNLDWLLIGEGEMFMGRDPDLEQLKENFMTLNENRRQQLIDFSEYLRGQQEAENDKNMT